MRKVMILVLSILALASCSLEPKTKSNGEMNIVNGTGNPLGISVRLASEKTPAPVRVSAPDRPAMIPLEEGVAHVMDICLLGDAKGKTDKGSIVLEYAVMDEITVDLSADETDGYIFVKMENGRIVLSYSWRRV